MVASQRATRFVGEGCGQTVAVGFDRRGDCMQATAALGLGGSLPRGLGGGRGPDCGIELGGVGGGEGCLDLAKCRVDDVELFTIPLDETTVDQKVICH